MPTLPWTTPHRARPGTTAYVMASRFTLRSRRQVPGFFLQSMRAWAQVRKAPGALGVSLEARPTTGVFSTLSAWEDREALFAFAEAEPHRSIMASLRPVMRDSVFVFWEVPVSELPPDWADAKRRLSA